MSEPEPDADPELINAEQVREAVATALLDDSRRKARVRLDVEILRVLAEARGSLGEFARNDASDALDDAVRDVAARLARPWSLP